MKPKKCYICGIISYTKKLSSGINACEKCCDQHDVMPPDKDTTPVMKNPTTESPPPEPEPAPPPSEEEETTDPGLGFPFYVPNTGTQTFEDYLDELDIWNNGS